MSGSTEPILLPTDRKIQFNDCVEQCIAVDNEDSSGDDGIEINISSKKRGDCLICKLAPTKLKGDLIHKEEYSPLYSNNTYNTSWDYFNFFL